MLFLTFDYDLDRYPLIPANASELIELIHRDINIYPCIQYSGVISDPPRFFLLVISI